MKAALQVNKYKNTVSAVWLLPAIKRVKENRFEIK